MSRHHSPAPWRIEPIIAYQGDDGLTGANIVSANGSIVAEVRGAIFVGVKDHDEHLANAFVLSAATDFFSSAKDLLEAWDARTTVAQQIVTGKSDTDLQKQAMAAIEGLRAAIAKATGRAS